MTKKKRTSILLIIVLLFSLFTCTGCTKFDNENYWFFQGCPDFYPSIAKLGLGVLDGTKTLESCSYAGMQMMIGIYIETGINPVISISHTEEHEVGIYRGQPLYETIYKDVKINAYYAKGMTTRYITKEEFLSIQKWQNENNVQVIYPYVDDDLVFKDRFPSTDASVWYKCKDAKLNPDLDKDGNFIPAYLTDSNRESKTPYESLRISSDPGNYIYAVEKETDLVHVRIFCYTYYHFQNNITPVIFP